MYPSLYFMKIVYSQVLGLGSRKLLVVFLTIKPDKIRITRITLKIRKAFIKTDLE